MGLNYQTHVALSLKKGGGGQNYHGSLQAKNKRNLPIIFKILILMRGRGR